MLIYWDEIMLIKTRISKKLVKGIQGRDQQKFWNYLLSSKSVYDCWLVKLVSKTASNVRNDNCSISDSLLETISSYHMPFKQDRILVWFFLCINILFSCCVLNEKPLQKLIQKIIILKYDLSIRRCTGSDWDNLYLTAKVIRSNG